MLFRPFQTSDEDAVIALWQRCELTRPWNDPRKDIARKLPLQPDLFLVGLDNDRLVATVMAGYEGHRGWINYLAVAPDMQRQGIGRQLIARVEQILLDKGCPKINLQIRTDNESVLAFYQAIGYEVDKLVSLGKRLISDVVVPTPAD